MTQDFLFKFKQFEIAQDKTTMKVNSDGVLLGAWSEVGDRKLVLDIGTGTGIIALMLAQKNDTTTVHAIEIEATAYEQASENVAASKFNDRMNVYHTSLQDFASVTKPVYDLIVSNPPFFTGGTFSENENKANVRHTIKLSHTDLLGSVKKLLLPTGCFDVILPYLEGLRFVEMAEKYDLYLQRMTELRPRPDRNIERLVLRFGKTPSTDVITDGLVMYKDESSSEYSDQYTILTKDYYLKH